MLFNNKDDETDFCESYKSQVLGTDTVKKRTSAFGTFIKLLTILILLAIIIVVSIYGYNYFMNAQKAKAIPLPPVSIQISDEDLVVTDEEETIVKEEKNISIVSTAKVKSELSDIDKITLDIKNEINKSIISEKNNTDIKDKLKVNVDEINNSKTEEKSLEVPTSTPEAKYLEELADLSKEIDKEAKQ